MVVANAAYLTNRTLLLVSRPNRRKRGPWLLMSSHPLGIHPNGLSRSRGLVSSPLYTQRRIILFAEYSLHYRSWQQALMAAGLVKQIDRCGRNESQSVDYADAYAANETPTWCSTSLLEDLRGAQTLLWDSIAGSEQGKSHIRYGALTLAP